MLVPPLRFPGFTDEWKKKSMQDIAPLQRGFDLPTQNVENGNIPVVYSNGILRNHSEGKCHGPGLVTGRSGTIGKFTFIDKGEYWPHNTSLWVTDFKDNYPKFIYYLYSTIKIEQYATGSGVPTLNRNDVHRHRTFIPSVTEQKRISEFLSLLDERIATQNKIIEDLKKLKSAIIDKVFCLPSEKQPNKRLDGFNGNWEIVKLSEICERITDRNSDVKCNLVLTIAAKYGLVSQLDFFNKSVASENLSSYYVLKKGDFAYNKSYSGEYVWGAIKKLKYYEEGVLSPLYICFRPNQEIINLDFLAFYFESKKWHRGISEIAGEGARNHGLLNISVIDFFNTIHRIPSLLEQSHIASLLQSYQNKIYNEEKLLLHYQTQRKYLLSSMFI